MLIMTSLHYEANREMGSSKLNDTLHYYDCAHSAVRQGKRDRKLSMPSPLHKASPLRVDRSHGDLIRVQVVQKVVEVGDLLPGDRVGDHFCERALVDHTRSPDSSVRLHLV
jgi:hypothetical protein